MPERFSASNAAKHMACTASANLDAAIPGWIEPVEDRTADTAANRGTARHEMLEPILNLTTKDVRGFARLLSYVADVRETRRFNVMVEQSVTAEWLASKPKTTADLVLYTQDEIHVLDSKWGKIPVAAYDNAQLLYYAVCYAPLAPKAKGVKVHIMQPAIDNFDSWFIDTPTLKKFMDEAIATDMRIANGDLTFGPSDHCKFCPANPHGRGLKGRPFCPELMQLYYPTPFHEDEILSL